jgi:hypothetical protein
MKPDLDSPPKMPPPSRRAALAAAAVVIASLLNGALLAIFDRQVPTPMRLATPALERALDACQLVSARAPRERCRVAVAEHGAPASAPLTAALDAAALGEPTSSVPR